MNLNQIIDKLDTLYYVVDSVTTEEEQTGLFIFFSQYKSILGQCNKIYPKEVTIKKMLLSTFNIRAILHQAKDMEGKYALQEEIKTLLNLIRHIHRFGKSAGLHNQLIDSAAKSKSGTPESPLYQ